MPKEDHDKEKHDHDKHKHDHDKHKHDHDKHKHYHDKHKHDHDKHKHDNCHDSEIEPCKTEPDVEEKVEIDSGRVEQVQAAMGSAKISDTSVSVGIKKTEKKKITIKTSRFLGGDSGTSFDDGIHKRILQISVSGGAVVDSITMLYHGGQKVTHGGKGGDEKTLLIGSDEYVNEVVVRANNRCVQQLTFKTNKGRKLGPVGGKGFAVGNFRKGEEYTLTAPSSEYMLKGIKGRKDKYLDAIALHWGKVVLEDD